MICEMCQKEHNGDYASGRFCSAKCARGFSTKRKREEISLKVSKTLKGKGLKPGKPFQKGYDPRRPIRNAGFFQRMATLRIAKRNKRIQELPWDELKPSEQRIKVFHEQNGCCAICSLDKWLGKTLILTYHHKDGNKYNNIRINVEFLCPNCHSQTDTFGTRNFKNRIKATRPICIYPPSPNNNYLQGVKPM